MQHYVVPEVVDDFETMLYRTWHNVQLLWRARQLPSRLSIVLLSPSAIDVHIVRGSIVQGPLLNDRSSLTSSSLGTVERMLTEKLRTRLLAHILPEICNNNENVLTFGGYLRRCGVQLR